MMEKNNVGMPPILKLSYEKGDLIIKEGDYGVSIYKVLEGTVGVFRTSEGKDIRIATLAAGDIFGERTFLRGSTRSRFASVRAMENVVVEVWHAARLSKEYEQMPPVIKYMTDQIMARAVRMDNLVLSLIAREQKKKAVREKTDPLTSQRRYYRKPVDMACHYRPAGATGRFMLKGRIRDISLGGLALVVEQRDMANVSFDKGSRFDVSAMLPNSQKIQMTAEVVAFKIHDHSPDLIVNMSISDMSDASKKSLGFFLMP